MVPQTEISKTENYEELWTHKEVRDLHARFDTELDAAESQKDFEKIFQNFFSSTGLLERELDTWRGADIPLEEAMGAAMELMFFKYLIHLTFFLKGYPEALVETWWKKRGPQRFDTEESFQDETVLRLLRQFNEEAHAASSLAEFEQVGGQYLSPNGVLAHEFARAEKLDEAVQLERCAELFQAKGYIESTLFAVDFSTKAEAWPVPFVRGLVYGFERDLKTVTNEKEVKALKKKYLGKGGVFEKADERARDEKNEAAEQLLKTFQQSVHQFFEEDVKAGNEG